jgi:hypothetical protein
MLVGITAQLPKVMILSAVLTASSASMAGSQRTIHSMFPRADSGRQFLKANILAVTSIIGDLQTALSLLLQAQPLPRLREERRVASPRDLDFRLSQQ